jgi:hypothetical protein
VDWVEQPFEETHQALSSALQENVPVSFAAEELGLLQAFVH